MANLAPVFQRHVVTRAKKSLAPLAFSCVFRTLQVREGGSEGFRLILPYSPYSPRQEPKGTVNDPSGLSQTLARIFQDRKQAHLYKPGMETRTDLPEDERVQKTVVIKVARSLYYGDVIKIIDVVKGAGANLIVLQLDDLP